MKTICDLIIGLAFGVLVGQVSGQGTVSLWNLGHAINAPIYDVDGKTGLGPAFLVQLYAGPQGGSLQPIGAPIPFAGVGYFFGPILTIATVPTGAFATAQVAAWRASDGSTFEAANHPGGHVGSSSLFDIGPLGGGGPPTKTPAPLFGLQSFSLYVVPEPSVLALGLFGSLAFGLRRRMRRRWES